MRSLSRQWFICTLLHDIWVPLIPCPWITPTLLTTSHLLPLHPFLPIPRALTLYLPSLIVITTSLRSRSCSCARCYCCSCSCCCCWCSCCDSIDECLVNPSCFQRATTWYRLRRWWDVIKVFFWAVPGHVLVEASSSPPGVEPLGLELWEGFGPIVEPKAALMDLVELLMLSEFLYVKSLILYGGRYRNDSLLNFLGRNEICNWWRKYGIFSLLSCHR